MNTMEKNPRVRAYFSQFDREATRLTSQRARNLREELLAHLLDALPDNPSDAEVSRVLRDMGDPSAIVGQEAESAVRAGYLRPSIGPVVGPAVAALVLGVAILIVTPPLSTLPGPFPLIVVLVLVVSVAALATVAIRAALARTRRIERETSF